MILPAAGWGEKEGTFINSERRFGVSHKVSRAPGQALADFHIFRLVAEYWGCADLFKRWTSAEAAFDLLKEVTRNQPCDITGIENYAMIERNGGIQWPCTISDAENLAQERRLFEDGKFFTPDDRARFIFEATQEVPEPVDKEFPFVLLTGRGSSAQWHTQSRTAKSAILRKLHPKECWVEIHPQDAHRLGIQDADLARVISRRGTLQARARVTATVQCGQVFLPMHYAEVNQLTLSIVDPVSRQPSYKHCAVRLEATC
jgi:assimilatory nitrate reductase catalytic subunit